MTTAAFIVFGACLLGLASYDVRSRRIPNPWVLVLALAGIGARALALGPGAIVTGAVGMLVGAALLLLPFALGWMGGGDVKLLAAAGAWLGPVHVIEAALVGLVLGGVWAGALALRHPHLRREVGSYFLIAASGAAVKVDRRAKRETVPL